MQYINTPIQFKVNESEITIERSIADQVKMLDSFIELIVFTPRGSFLADPDFGFEYWNYEYSNIHYSDIRNKQSSMMYQGLYNDVTRKECQESLKRSLETYEPKLKHIDVGIELLPVDDVKQIKGRKVFSKYEVTVKVTGHLEDGLGMVKHYEKKVKFLMEPTVKQIVI